MQYDEPRLFIGGQWVESSGEPLDVESPSSGVNIGTVATASKQDVDMAVAAARRAFDDGPWPRMRPADRSAALHRFADALEARQTEMAQRLVGDLGTPISTVHGMQLGRPLQHWRYLADLAARVEDEPIPPAPYVHQPGVVVPEPVGVVAAITAYNYPFMIMTWKVGPALAAGCSVVLKPNEVDPLLAFEFARAAEDADLPPGVVNLVIGGAETGARLVAHDGVDAVSFTGSVPVGRKILEGAAGGLKKVVLELGGKSPAVVLDDADVDSLIPKVVGGFLLNCGQACGATTRLIVAESLYDEVVEKVVAQTRLAAVGDPHDETTQVGPLVSADQRARVEALVDTVDEDGGEILLGGGRPQGLDAGYYISPTVVADSNDSRLGRNEAFGPVLSILPHPGQKDAVRLANDSPYGLAAVVYGGNLRNALTVARDIRAGTVCVNQGVFNPAAPIGGYKASGLGREGGRWGLSEFQELKHLTWRH